MRLLSIWLSFAILSLAPHSYAEGWPEDEPQEAISALLHLPVSLGAEIVLYSLSLTGTQYKYGGDSPEKGFDCSGLIRHVYQRVSGLLLPHSARAINAAATKVPLDELQPGDVVFYNTLKRAYSHVGIYLGNQRFIHAASSGRTTQVSSMTDKYWLKRFDGAGRLLTPLLPALRVNEESP